MQQPTTVSSPVPARSPSAVARNAGGDDGEEEEVEFGNDDEEEVLGECVRLDIMLSVAFTCIDLHACMAPQQHAPCLSRLAALSSMAALSACC